PGYLQAVDEAGIKINIDIHPFGATHPNTYKLTLKNNRETHTLTALSTGGGMIQVIEVDGASVLMAGDIYETLVYTKSPELLAEFLNKSVEFDEIKIHRGNQEFVELKSNQFLPNDLKAELENLDKDIIIKRISPVLPVLTRKDLSVPFITAAEMLEYNKDKDLSLWELAIHYESARGNISHDEVFEKMRSIVTIMQNAIEIGINGTSYADRILGPQSVNFKEQIKKKTLVEGDVLNNVILCTSAMMEVKSSMGVIVAAPTAGSCGALPGAVIGTATTLKLSQDEMVKAMLAAGIIGVFIAAHATFAAEVGGCMAECGSGSGMAAAGLVVLKNGTLDQSLAAASMTLQASLGMICDMIADRVEAPCLNRNVMAASTAISIANMALADYDQVIPLDEVIETMKKVGDAIPNTLRCTGLGGLAITKTAKKIEAWLGHRDTEGKHRDAEGDTETQRKTFFKVC
ncbi:MAG TPA: L-serine ammonia-lyase, iron-sulfur-dependent, subunit alpha, partial [Chitinophagaceae bacterium]|nr:L-serine ammonia-lyase, iron-sulfur-dependent, subunit alpha [Chitinophagaceae bacterium]